MLSHVVNNVSDELTSSERVTPKDSKSHVALRETTKIPKAISMSVFPYDVSKESLNERDILCEGICPAIIGMLSAALLKVIQNQLELKYTKCTTLHQHRQNILNCNKEKAALSIVLKSNLAKVHSPLLRLIAQKQCCSGQVEVK